MAETEALTAHFPDERRHTILDHFADLAPDVEHLALLGNPGRFNLLGRKGDLLDEGVAAVFGLAGAEAELLGLCFQAEKFTPVRAEQWLAERGFAPLIFVSNSGRDRYPASRSRWAGDCG